MDLTDSNYHKKLIEMCDCYLETDFPAQLKTICETESLEPEEDALRYLALSIMYCITHRARKLAIKRKKGALAISMKNGHKTELPVPAVGIADSIFAIVSSILHLEGNKTETTLSLGLRNDQVDLHVKLKIEDEKQSLKIKFPKLD